ncbi:hypothetical protein BDP55DRAFT_660866 [Colletotrichum godetiae]|uniref:Uncharacterized protein n=1 Tax=Colletotrichum godetiae TaxID=1209918 RepID=A0AAJ0AMX3_9PEZI|nr:uncharacterized protein BDP55DRAFT_660866 [Colletotrichum godetiae]KAK1676827.1 hypothetical protein BDP55DRAFT_660866 [Colletotrichum godetiae]
MDPSFQHPDYPDDVDVASQLSGSYFVVPSPATTFWDELGSSWPWLPSLREEPETCHSEELFGSHFFGDWIRLPPPDEPCVGPALPQGHPSNPHKEVYPEPAGYQSAGVPSFHDQSYSYQLSQVSDTRTFPEPSVILSSPSQWARQATHKSGDIPSSQYVFPCEGDTNPSPAPDQTPSLTSSRAGHRKRPRSEIEALDKTTSSGIHVKSVTADYSEQVEKELHDVEAGSPSSKRLACPFYKFDRVTHLHCARFHLKRVKDVKQHLLRKHRFHCAGCHEGFKDKRKCKGHVDDQQCQSRAGPRSAGIDEGISEHQVNDLLQRMNSGPKGDEHSWYTIWDILFPGQSFPASPFLKSGVEEVISTVCDLWQKNGPKVISSLNNDPLQTSLINGTELPKTMPVSLSKSSTSDNLLLILGRLAKVSAAQSEGNEANLPRSRLCPSSPAKYSPSTTFMTLGKFDDKELEFESH